MAYADERGTLERLEDAVLRRARQTGRLTWFSGAAARRLERDTVKMIPTMPMR